MISDIWKQLSLMIVATSLSVATLSPMAVAQDSFREFDRKMVATPAELFEALSTLRPSAQQKQRQDQRQRKIEQAGRKFLSDLTPEQKEKAWEFAEKYLRKNGVDATSSQKLMEQFGLPTELQNELSEQFRKQGNRPSNSNFRQSSEPDDDISRILRKAKENFNAGSPDGVQKKKDSTSADLDDGSKLDVGRDRNGDADTKSNRDPKLKKPKSRTKTERKSETTDRPGRKLEGKPDARGDQRKRDAKDSRSDPKKGNANSSWKPPAPRSSDRTTKADRDQKTRRLKKRDQRTDGDNSGSTEADLDRLLRQLEGFKKHTVNDPKSGASADGKSSLSKNNLDWEKVIDDLAKKGSTKEGSNPSRGSTANPMNGSADRMIDPAVLDRAKKMLDEMESNDRIDRNKLKRAKDVISRSIESQRKADSKAQARTTKENSASSEKIGTRFDRLIMKAAERTLESSNDDPSVSKSVGSMFGSLIERVQKQTAKKKNERDKAASRSSNGQDLAGNQNDSSNGDNRTASEANNGNNESNSNSASQANDPFQQSAPKASNSGIDTGKILDSLPDFSGINPTHIFTFFAVVGLCIFVGYLLAQSVVGSEATISKRKVIRQIRNTQMKSPKDLIETVDVFLLSKFGIKSSWWNAGLVQNVLKSSSPKLQTRVDELIQDYIRARYMRDDIQISTADQQQYKKTLEELSSIDIKPLKDLESVSSSRVLGTPASAEG